MSTTLQWAGILACLSQSALFSGLNLALFSLSKLELEVAARKHDPRALRVLALRHDANFALVTILWGNVGVNVLLALLSSSLLSGVAAFLFSTVVITLFAEIMPQAWFSRHALTVASSLSPVLRFYQFLLFPIARPTAWALDAWLGPEGMRYFPERDLRQLIKLHMDSAQSDIACVEGQGALNFLDIDDVHLADEGEPLAPDSVIRLPFREGRPVFPEIQPRSDDPFLRQVQKSGCSWAVLVDEHNEPQLALRTGTFLREALFSPRTFKPHQHCHRPLVLRDGTVRLGTVIPRFRVRSGSQGTDIVDDDLLLLWTDTPRIITATDLLGRLLRGIGQRPKLPRPGARG